MSGNETVGLGSLSQESVTVHPRALAGTVNQSQKGDLTNSFSVNWGLNLLNEAARMPNDHNSHDLSIITNRISLLPLSDSQKNAVIQRLCKSLNAVVRLLDSSEGAIQWLKTPNPALGGEVPLEKILRSDEDARQVEQLIGRIQYGVFA